MDYYPLGYIHSSEKERNLCQSARNQGMSDKFLIILWSISCSIEVAYRGIPHTPKAMHPHYGVKTIIVDKLIHNSQLYRLKMLVWVLFLIHAGAELINAFRKDSRGLRLSLLSGGVLIDDVPVGQQVSQEAPLAITGGFHCGKQQRYGPLLRVPLFFPE